MRKCLFCDPTKLTREHIWPDWIVEIFPSNSSYTGTRAHSKLGVKSWPANSITQRSRLVCKQCNGIWMSQIEAATSPILGPLITSDLPRCTLDTCDQLTLATWACLRAM